MVPVISVFGARNASDARVTVLVLSNALTRNGNRDLPSDASRPIVVGSDPVNRLLDISRKPERQSLDGLSNIPVEFRGRQPLLTKLCEGRNIRIRETTTQQVPSKAKSFYHI